MAENSWDILGHKFHQNHSNRVISYRSSQYLQQKWLWLQSVGGWLLSTWLFCWHQHSGSMCGYSETRSRSNVWKEHMHTERHKYDKTRDKTFPLQILGLFASWFIWPCLDDNYLWHKMVYKMSQLFPTSSLDITNCFLKFTCFY